MLALRNNAGLLRGRDIVTRHEINLCLLDAHAHEELLVAFAVGVAATHAGRTYRKFPMLANRKAARELLPSCSPPTPNGSGTAAPVDAHCSSSPPASPRRGLLQ